MDNLPAPIETNPAFPQKVKLKRTISLPFLILYGVGIIIGAGIYALVGKVAGFAGILSPLSFLVAGILAALTAFSYMELSSRYPVSASEVKYVNTAFKKNHFSIIIGFLTAFASTVGCATLANAFSGYFKEFFDINSNIIIATIIILFGIIAIWGIRQSVIVACAISILGIFGLILIFFLASGSLADLPEIFAKNPPSLNLDTFTGVISGAFLAFFAYIGFENMANIAEEVKKPKKNVPIGIILALLISTLLYLMISLVSIAALPIETLSSTDAPMAAIVAQHSSFSPKLISLISLISISNGILIMLVMSSRILYGMAKQNLAPQILGKINARTRTPIIATLLTLIISLSLATIFPITPLANLTSFIVLFIFAFVNLSLWKIKNREKTHSRKKNIIHVPKAIPVIGFFLNAGFLIFKALSLILA